MSQGVNKVILVGLVGQDAELKFTNGGNAVIRFSFATTEQWKTNGEKQERTEWHRCVMWGKHVEALHRHIVKGTGLYLEGRNETRKWEDKNGTTHYSTEVNVAEVVFLNNGRRSGQDHKSQGPLQEPEGTLPLGPAGGDDNIPF